MTKSYDWGYSAGGAGDDEPRGDWTLEGIDAKVVAANWAATHPDEPPPDDAPGPWAYVPGVAAIGALGQAAMQAGHNAATHVGEKVHAASQGAPAAPPMASAPVVLPPPAAAAAAPAPATAPDGPTLDDDKVKKFAIGAGVVGIMIVVVGLLWKK
jgi:hypothetical protein